MVATVVFVLGAYLVGAIPSGLLIGWARGVDIRKQGSCNIGATNAGRVLGREWGYLCLAFDILKGLIPAVAAKYYLMGESPDAGALLQWLAIGLAAVLGHVFPIYLRFRGGKGVATTVGVALGIFPFFTVAMTIALLGYALVRFSTGWVSAGSLTIALLFPLAFVGYSLVEHLPLHDYWPLHVVAVGLGLLIVLRHRANIQRLWRGQEIRAA